MIRNGLIRAKEHRCAKIYIDILCRFDNKVEKITTKLINANINLFTTFFVVKMKYNIMLFIIMSVGS